MPEPEHGERSPAIAAIIPVFNRPRAVLEALDSVLAQSLPPAKLVVIDDGSTDDTAARVEEWIAARCPPFEARLLRQPNSGAAAARNRGVAEAPGCEILAFLDSDDLWPADYLARVGAVFAKHPDAVAVTCDRMNLDVATNKTSPRRGFAHYETSGRHVAAVMLMEGPPGTPNTAFRTSAFQQTGGYDGRWPTGQDYDLMLRLSLLGRWCHAPGEPILRRLFTGAATGGGDPPLSRKYADRVFRRAQLLHRFIHELGGAAVVPEKLWRKRLGELWFRAGRALAKLERLPEAADCFQRTLDLRPWHVAARVRNALLPRHRPGAPA